MIKITGELNEIYWKIWFR